MIKEKVITLSIMVASFAPIYAEEVKLIGIHGEPEDKSNEIPIHVDLDRTNKLLRMDFKKSIDCTVIVSCEEGIVFHQSINAKSFQNVKLNLRNYQKGNYEIRFYDDEGNILDGIFFLEE